MNTKLQAGDTVIIAKEGTRTIYHPDFEGRVGTIERASRAAANHWVVKISDITFKQRIHEADLTKVVPTPVRSFKKGSQCDRILKYLLTGKSITPIKARSLFGAERLAARILEIRQSGHKIKAIIKTDLNGKVYAEYSLRNAGRIW